MLLRIVNEGMRRDAYVKMCDTNTRGRFYEDITMHENFDRLIELAEITAQAHIALHECTVSLDDYMVIEREAQKAGGLIAPDLDWHVMDNNYLRAHPIYFWKVMERALGCEGTSRALANTIFETDEEDASMLRVVEKDKGIQEEEQEETTIGVNGLHCRSDDFSIWSETEEGRRFDILGLPMDNVKRNMLNRLQEEFASEFAVLESIEMPEEGTWPVKENKHIDCYYRTDSARGYRFWVTWHDAERTPILEARTVKCDRATAARIHNALCTVFQV